MTAGLPGTGVGGMFYLLCALLMPLRQLYGRPRGSSAPGARGGWRAVAKQTGLAGGILAGMWVTGWLLGLGVDAVKAAAPSAIAAGPPPGNLFRAVALAVSIGTLLLVLIVVEAVGLWLTRRPRLPPPARPQPLLLAVGILTAAAQGGAAQSFALADSTPARAVAPDGLAQARALARAGRTDDAIPAYERWLAAHPGDVQAWRELGRQWQRAGRPADAARALARAQALEPDPATGRRLAWVRAAAAPTLSPRLSGTLDSDGNRSFRLGAAGELRAAGPARVGLSYDREQVSDGNATAGLHHVALHLQWRPTSVLRGEVDAGVTRRDASDGVDLGTVATGQLRLRWRAPAGGPALDLRLQRSALAASPLLVANRVVRTEFRGIVEFPVARRLKLRGIGRAAVLRDDAEPGPAAPAVQPSPPDSVGRPDSAGGPNPPDPFQPPQDPLPRSPGTNSRTAMGVVLAVPVAPAAEVSAGYHELRHARAATAGYFAPRLVQTMEAGSYVEIETSRAILLVLDAGVGMQRVAEFGAPLGPWRRALRLYSLIVVPLATGRDLRIELEGEDSLIGREAVTSGPWRYGSAAISLRWAL